MTGKEQNDRIDHYLLNKMDDNEREAFENDLNSDPELRRLTRNRQVIIMGIKAGFNSELKEKLKAEDTRRKNAFPEKRIQYLSAIAAIVIIGLFSQVFLSRIKNDPARIYSEYYRTYPNVSIPISRSEENSENPYYLYETGDFRGALSEFKSLIEAEPGNETVLFYAAITCMELLDFDNAIKYLEIVAGEDQNRFTRPSYWYLSLAYINSENIEEASAWLEKLAEGDDIYSNDAKKILKRIN